METPSRGVKFTDVSVTFIFLILVIVILVILKILDSNHFQPT